MTKLFNKVAMLLLCIVSGTYSAEKEEIVVITKDIETLQVQPKEEESFVIGNKKFVLNDLQTLTEKERKIFLQAARPNELHSCLTGTNNQLFCDSKFSLCCVKAANVNGLKRLPRSITSNLEVDVTDHCICSTHNKTILPSTLLATFVWYVAEGCSEGLFFASCCLTSCFCGTFCLAQCAKQRCCSKKYAVDKDIYLQ